jgi:hypothetical protein
LVAVAVGLEKTSSQLVSLEKAAAVEAELAHIILQWVEVVPEQQVRQDKDMMEAPEIMAGEVQVPAEVPAQLEAMASPVLMVPLVLPEALEHKVVLLVLQHIMLVEVDQEIILNMQAMAAMGEVEMALLVA